MGSNEQDRGKKTNVENFEQAIAMGDLRNHSYFLYRLYMRLRQRRGLPEIPFKAALLQYQGMRNYYGTHDEYADHFLSKGMLGIKAAVNAGHLALEENQVGNSIILKQEPAPKPQEVNHGANGGVQPKQYG